MSLHIISFSRKDSKNKILCSLRRSIQILGNFPAVYARESNYVLNISANLDPSIKVFQNPFWWKDKGLKISWHCTLDKGSRCCVFRLFLHYNLTSPCFSLFNINIICLFEYKFVNFRSTADTVCSAADPKPLSQSKINFLHSCVMAME